MSDWSLTVLLVACLTPLCRTTPSGERADRDARGFSHLLLSGSTQGALRVHAPSRSISVRDIVGNAEMKLRTTETRTEDREQLKRQLDEKESSARSKREKIEGGEAPAMDPHKALEWLMANDPDAEPKREEGEKREESSESEDDDDDEEEEELLRELEKIKRERAEEAALKQRAAEEEARMEQRNVAANSNPLLAAATQTVTKKWYEDTVFRNQAKNETKQPKRFVNDTIRSDFHRKFLDRFIK